MRDESGQSTVKTLSAHGTTVVEAAASLAGQLNSTPKPYTSNNPEAIKELFTGHADAALALDPAYGAAHVARIEALVRTGRKDELPAALAAAKPAKLTDVERARLQALVADTPKARERRRCSDWLAPRGSIFRSGELPPRPPSSARITQLRSRHFGRLSRSIRRM